MLAARIHAWGTPPVVEEVLEPQPVDGEVLVRVEAATLSHLDTTVADGVFAIKPELPYVGGIEGSARALRVIASTTKILVNEVIMSSSAGATDSSVMPTSFSSAASVCSFCRSACFSSCISCVTYVR